jgi:O-antigen/teichoic acid export membrane protein
MGGAKMISLNVLSRESMQGTRPVLLSVVTRLTVLPISGLLGLLTARVTIGHIGPQLFGYVTVIATLTALLPFADLGVGAALTNAAAQAHVHPDRAAELQRVALTSVRTLAVSAFVAVAAGVTIALTTGWSGLLGVSAIGSQSANVATVAVLVLFALSLPFSLGQRVLIGTQRNHLSVAVSAVSAPVMFAATFALAAAGASAAWFALPSALGGLTAAVLSAHVARRTSTVNLFELCRHLVPAPQWPGQEIRRAALPMFVILIGLPLALQTDRIILSHRADADQLAIYAVAAQLFLMPSAAISAAGMALWPIFAGERSRRVEERRDRGLWLAMVGCFGLGALVAGSAMIVVGPVLARLMTRGSIVLPTSLLVAMAALLLVQAAHLPSGMFLTDESGLLFQAKCVAVMVVVNVGVSWWAAGHIGARGPIVGSLVAVGVAQLLPTAFRTWRRYDDQAASASTTRRGTLSEAEVDGATASTLMVVPTLGQRPEWIRQSVESVRAQGPHCALVLVAPSSADLSFLELAAGERVVVCDLAGVPAALNAVWKMHAADYEFLTWLGDDDLLAPGAIESAAGVLRSHPLAAAVYGQVRYITSSGATWYTSHPTRLAASYLRWGKNFVPQPGSLIRRSAAAEVGWLNESLRNSFDQDLFTRLNRIGAIRYLPRILASYRVHPASITATKGSADESEMVRRSVHGRVGRVAYRIARPLTRVVDQIVYSTQSRVYAPRPGRAV